MIRLVDFSHFRLGVSHISLRPHKIQSRGWKKKNKRTNTDLGQLQAQEREFVILCILRAFVDYIFSTKSTRNANSSLTVFSPCLLLLTVLPLDCYLMPTGLFCPPLSTALSIFSGTFLPFSTSDLVGDLELRPFVWVSRQNRQRDFTPVIDSG